MKNLTFQSTFPGDLGHRHTAKTSENAGRLFKIEGPPFGFGVPLGVILGANLAPKWTLQTLKDRAQIVSKIYSKTVAESIRIRVQSDRKMVPNKGRYFGLRPSERTPGAPKRP